MTKTIINAITIMMILAACITPIFANGQMESGSGSEHYRDTGAVEAGEEAGNSLTLNETYDFVRKGSRLIMKYDRASNSFNGTVENTTTKVLQNVRVEIHLNNGIELGPTKPIDLAAGEKVPVSLKASNKAFNGWTPHAEVGLSEHGAGSEDSETGSETGRESGGEHSGREGS